MSGLRDELHTYCHGYVWHPATIWPVCTLHAVHTSGPSLLDSCSAASLSHASGPEVSQSGQGSVPMGMRVGAHATQALASLSPALSLMLGGFHKCPEQTQRCLPC